MVEVRVSMVESAFCDREVSGSARARERLLTVKFRTTLMRENVSANANVSQSVLSTAV